MYIDTIFPRSLLFHNAFENILTAVMEHDLGQVLSKFYYIYVVSSIS